MVDFRRWILALAVLALFAGLAGAQTQTVQQLSCATNVSSTPQLRAEGYTEQTGDITIQCTGGNPVTPGSLIPTVNVTIFLNTAVTSRLLPQSNISNNISEALLMIDEPGAVLNGPPIVAGFGPAAPQRVCGVTGTFFGPTASTSLGSSSGVAATPLTGCSEFATNVGGVTVATDTFQGTVATTATPGANVFQGVVNANSVTFFGVPVLPPVSTGTSRVFRITNIRANATALSGGSASGATPVVASIAVSNSAALPITNPTPTVGFVQSGLSATASGVSNQQQCKNDTKVSISTVTFTELFGTAFKTRVAAQSNVGFAGQGIPSATSPGNQNVPGAIYNSESNFVLPVSGGTAGLADFGTRLKATFNNVPAGVRLFVSVANVVNNAVGITAPAIPGGSAANGTTTGYALLVSSETAADGNQITNSAGFFPSVSATDNGPNNGTVGIAEIPVVNGSATAVWEVVNTNPSSLDTLRFAVYTTFTANVAQNSPPAGTATVNLSFAPTPPSFTATTGAAASSSLTIPRFIADPNAARNAVAINICRTILLYPFITNQSGFDTGIAIANTSTDVFGTGPQSGTCTLNWFSGTTNPAPTSSGSIASGTVYTTLASTTVSGFQGYMIAVCGFQYAHGFAFISDLGARNLAMGYLALVIGDPSSQANGVRNASGVGCGTGDIPCGAGESDAH